MVRETDGSAIFLTNTFRGAHIRSYLEESDIVIL